MLWQRCKRKQQTDFPGRNRAIPLGTVVTNPLLKVAPILPECQVGKLPGFPFQTGISAVVNYGSGNSSLLGFTYDVDLAPDSSIWFESEGLVRYNPKNDQWTYLEGSNIRMSVQPKTDGGRHCEASPKQSRAPGTILSKFSPFPPFLRNRNQSALI